MEPSALTAMQKFQEELEKLKTAFAASLPSRVAEIEALWTKACTQSTSEDMRFLERALHSLAGSGATFGFPEISRQAKSFENKLSPLVGKSQAPPPDQIGILAREWILLRQAMGSSEIGGDRPSFETAAARLQPGVRLAPVLALGNEGVVAAVKEQMRHFAVDVLFLPASDHENILRAASGAVVVFECDFSPGDLAFLEILARRCQEEYSVLIVVSARADTTARLAAVRAGVDSYLTLPLKVGALLDRLDELVFPETVEPPRVLIVDDEESVARYTEYILKSRGMITRVQTAPLMILDDMETFAPDCILMDLYMPQCDGPELARVIRQIDQYMSIPIVFLSMEQNVEKQVLAVAQGGDDFLTKPVNPEHLSGMIQDRIRRYRIIRSLMTHDSLTGLLNHSNLKFRLSAEIDRAKRLRSGLAFAMIDIDHFKAVNDTYGHAVGDSVIKQLSRFLQRKLRRTDIIGRYGGEEFGVALTDLTDTAKAVSLLDALRQDFSEMPQYAGETPVAVTFSCGVALFTGEEDAETLCSMADEALYQSKHAGRNCVTAFKAS